MTPELQLIHELAQYRGKEPDAIFEEALDFSAQVLGLDLVVINTLRDQFKRVGFVPAHFKPWLVGRVRGLRQNKQIPLVPHLKNRNGVIPKPRSEILEAKLPPAPSVPKKPLGDDSWREATRLARENFHLGIQGTIQILAPFLRVTGPSAEGAVVEFRRIARIFSDEELLEFPSKNAAITAAKKRKRGER